MSVSCSTVLIQTDLHRLRSTKHPFPGIRKVDGHPPLARQGNGDVPRVGLLGDNLVVGVNYLGRTAKIIVAHHLA